MGDKGMRNWAISAVLSFCAMLVSFDGVAADSILIMSVDGAETSAARGSAIAQGARQKVAAVLSEQGFYIIDEQSVFATLGMKSDRRAAAKDMLLVSQIANKSTDPRLAHDYVVLIDLSVRGQGTDSGNTGTAVLKGGAKSIKGTFQKMWKGERTEPGDTPPEAVERATEAVAKEFSAVVKGWLDAEAGPKTVNYDIVFTGFEATKAKEIIDIMITEFPKYVGSDQKANADGSIGLVYRSQAPADKIIRWFHILLFDMDYEPGEDVEIKQISDNRFVLHLTGKTN
jgi:hypothetical protein